jgi:hypothetical protein
LTRDRKWIIVDNQKRRKTNGRSILRKVSREEGDEEPEGDHNEEQEAGHSGHLSHLRHQNVQNWQSLTLNRASVLQAGYFDTQPFFYPVLTAFQIQKSFWLTKDQIRFSGFGTCHRL